MSKRYTYIASRYYQEIFKEFDTLDEVFEAASRDNEFGSVYPLEVLDNGAVLFSNRSGHPLKDGSVPFLDAIYQWEHDNGID